MEDRARLVEEGERDLQGVIASNLAAAALVCSWKSRSAKWYAFLARKLIDGGLVRVYAAPPAEQGAEALREQEERTGGDAPAGEWDNLRPIRSAAGGNVQFPPWAKNQIMTPHEHEGTHNPPLWVIWKHGIGCDHTPYIDSVCDSVDSVRYNFAALWDSVVTNDLQKKVSVNIERIPANHRFASSLEDWFSDKTLTSMKSTIEQQRKTIAQYRRDVLPPRGAQEEDLV